MQMQLAWVVGGGLSRTLPNRGRRERPRATSSHECDVVVIGSGIGGLSCAGLLALYGLSTTVCESHSVAGGAAHAWQQDGYQFESGPSLYSGMAGTGTGANPIAHVLAAIGEPLELIEYEWWNVFVPEAPEGFATGVGKHGFDGLLEKVRGPAALAEWRRFQDEVLPLAQLATALPPASLRLDPGAVVSALGRYLPGLLASGGQASKLIGPFSQVMDAAGVTDPFIRNWMDLLCFLLSGLPASGTISAEVAFMFKQWYQPRSMLEFPRGGSQALVDALVRGVTKRGGDVRLGAQGHVEEILVEGGVGWGRQPRATGVRLRSGGVIKARRAVVSNAATPDMLRLLPPNVVPEGWRKEVEAAPLNPSFMHLHLGFDATGLDGLGMHHISVERWKGGVTQPQNVVLVSIPSVIDPSLAPPGRHCLHAYTPATEPFDLWEGLDRRSDEYLRLKAERSQVLWRAMERIIPDIRRRVEVELVGTPLTHQRFLRRAASRGSYGPAYKAGEMVFPFGTTPVKCLYCCGDFTFPGIGLPAVAASGAIVANTLVPLGKHLELLESLGI